MPAGKAEVLTVVVPLFTGWLTTVCPLVLLSPNVASFSEVNTVNCPLPGLGNTSETLL